ncbi:hypothetical protein HX004_07315 [Myroides sp. 1354]|uniref:hypothetical protein n=1 Tax=unclassified Myroides TaxID=2642485 RepID=UPI002578E242|nr:MULTISPECIES: hypothetical protein [unclassified Myroides]MDM1044869.1 hypothetical protein [Myroides sp. R163-1]MDM1055582.1 hypothetical protein [Myroides sp. 1354]MDM1068879.1 hypothetical protein [Myroides sp. 1372]
MKLRFLAFLLTIMTFISCDDAFKRQDFYLSNPTTKEIKVGIDDKTYVVAPNSYEILKLDTGEHKLTYNDQQTAFNVFYSNSGGIINPTLEPHYIYSMVYATEGNFDKFGATMREVWIDGVSYEDNIKSTNALFIDNNFYRCTYFLGEEYPEEQITYDKKAVGNFFNKFFTKAEFIAFYDAILVEEEKGFHQANQMADGENTITESNVVELVLPDVDQADVIASYKKEMELVEEYKNSTDAARQKAIHKELFDLAMSRSKLDINYSKLSTAQNQSMNDFVHASGRISGAGIIQL